MLCKVIGKEPDEGCTRANWGHNGRGIAVLLEPPEGTTPAEFTKVIDEMIKAGGHIIIRKEERGAYQD